MGLVADIQPPEIELRMAIIQKKAATERIQLSDEVVNFLASRVKSNIRELEGSLIRLGAQSSLTGEPIDVSMAKKILKDIISEVDRPITIEQIQKSAAEFYGIKYQDMKSKKRTKEIAIPRQVAMYISKQLTGSSLSDIGKNFGGKDHATVIYACKQIEERREKDEEFTRKVESLIKRIQG
jgi:chromosomal replication initiator protein